MIAARQELDLRPQLERLDRLIARSEGLDPGALSFAFRPLWQLDASSQAAVALQKAQATQIYAGLKLWPAEVTARLVEAQLVADGTYPNATAVFGEGGAAEVADRRATGDFDPDQPRDRNGRWTVAEQRAADPTVASEHLIESRSAAAITNPMAESEPGIGAGPQAPDGTPVTLVGLGGRRGGGAAGIAAVVGAAARFLRWLGRRLPERSYRTNSPPSVAPSLPPRPDGSGSPAAVPPEAGIARNQPSTPESGIRFGSNANQSYHAFRHTDEAGLDRTQVEGAVRNDLLSNIGRLKDGLNKGSVVVDGQRIEYNAFRLPSGEINVGRITTQR